MKKSEKKIKRAVSFIIASKGIQYLEINLIKTVKDLYSENAKHC
jgi:hypothetical protein